MLRFVIYLPLFVISGFLVDDFLNLCFTDFYAIGIDCFVNICVLVNNLKNMTFFLVFENI